MTGTGTHFVERCVHGTLLTQCRCPSKDKSVRIGPCPGPPRCPGSVPIVLLVDGPVTEEEVVQLKAEWDRRRLEEILLRLLTLGDEDWKEPGHPMNSWVSKLTVQSLAREAIEICSRLQLGSGSDGRLGKEGGS